MAQKIVGVDLGTYSVKAVTLAPKSRATPGRAVARTAFDVLAVGEVEVAPPAEGEDAAATRTSQRLWTCRPSATRPVL